MAATDPEPPTAEQPSQETEEIQEIQEIQEIDSEGDMIISVGDHDPRRFKVSSRFLSNGSKVFAVMFSSRFAEGQRLSSSSPKIIKLDDDPTSLAIVLDLLHMRNERVKRQFNSDLLLQVAITADK